MEFKVFKELQQKYVEKMTKDIETLFVVDVDKEEMWNLYLDSFPEGTNEIYRKRREFDCSCCRHFIKSIGNVVSIKNNSITTIWDFKVDDLTFGPVAKALSDYVKSKVVSDVFVTPENSFGTNTSPERLEDGTVRTWDHFYLQLNSKFVYKGSSTIGSHTGTLRDNRNVFKRSLEEISEDAVLTVLELISQKSLYKGEEWEAVLRNFLALHKEYHKLTKAQKELYCWEKSVEVGPVISKIKNHSIGLLLTDITDGTDLNEAVKKYEAVVAPSNYKRPKAIFTKKMIEEAQKTITELGYLESLGRRFAKVDDITVNNILYANKDSLSKMSGDVFDDLMKDATSNPKKFDKVEEVSIEDFISDILPNASNVEVMVENRHEGNLMSLIAPKTFGCKTMFKWNNPFSWAYKGNITDSMKERVKAAGGKVDGVLRFSIQWNDLDKYNPNDYDAHCVEPSGNHIYFGEKLSPKTRGNLDVDIIHPKKGVPAVENITWPSLSYMKDGTYKFYVNNFSHNGGTDGFGAEIEFDGQIYSFEYRKDLRYKANVPVAEVTLKDGKFTIKELLSSSVSSKTMWGLTTNQFYPVTVAMFSPNYWDEQKGIGNKHYFFMFKDCINNEAPNGFFNEYLDEKLMEHKRVFEALGSKMRVEDSEEQLSGLGFSSTQRNSFVCKVEGHFSRMVKVVI